MPAQSPSCRELRRFTVHGRRSDTAPPHESACAGGRGQTHGTGSQPRRTSSLDIPRNACRRATEHELFSRGTEMALNPLVGSLFQHGEGDAPDENTSKNADQVTIAGQVCNWLCPHSLPRGSLEGHHNRRCQSLKCAALERPRQSSIQAPPRFLGFGVTSLAGHGDMAPLAMGFLASVSPGRA